MKYRIIRITMILSFTFIFLFVGYTFATDTDFLGVPRPQGDAPDIGAFEYFDGGFVLSIQAPQNLRVVDDSSSE